MSLAYPKDLIVKKDRQLNTSGPRDHQLKHNASTPVVDSSLVDVLKEQIQILQDKLEAKVSQTASASSGWTDDQVNSEIEKAIRAELKSVNLTHATELSSLKIAKETLENNLVSLKTEYFNLAASIDSLRESLKVVELENASLREKLSNKEELIQQLKSSENKGLSITEDRLAAMIAEATKNITLSSSDTGLVNSDRPKMETVFVDPTASKSTLTESKLEAVEVSTNEREVLDDKVNKLKNLLGKLPSKK